MSSLVDKKTVKYTLNKLQKDKTGDMLTQTVSVHSLRPTSTYLRCSQIVSVRNTFYSSANSKQLLHLQITICKQAAMWLQQYGKSWEVLKKVISATHQSQISKSDLRDPQISFASIIYCKFFIVTAFMCFLRTFSNILVWFKNKFLVK